MCNSCFPNLFRVIVSNGNVALKVCFFVEPFFTHHLVSMTKCLFNDAGNLITSLASLHIADKQDDAFGWEGTSGTTDELVGDKLVYEL